MDLLIRSSGMEPTQFEEETKWHLIERMVPLVENNYNLCELGPRGTGKSFIYKEISPNSILISGGQSTVANLFYNMSTRQIGLVGLWDTVAFDEVAGIKFKDKDGIQIMKDFMASGSFARGREEKNANASMVFVGNINQSVENVLKSSHLFSPFPSEIAYDTAFFDRIHYYLPGWEIPKMRPEYITDEYGFIVDYLAEFFREMRKFSYSDATDEYFSYGNNLNQRDVISVRKTVSGLIKLIYPHGEYTKEELEEIVKYALVGRRRVKEQLKKIGGMEFHDVHFSYIDKEDMNEKYVSVPEQGGLSLIPEGVGKPGHIYTVNHSPETNLPGVYKIETENMSGNGKLEISGVAGKTNIRESIKTAYNYFKSNSGQISASIKLNDKNYLIEIQDLKGVGMTDELSLAAFIGLCSSALRKATKSQMVVLGSMSIGGTVNKVTNLADIFQATLDAGGKKVLLPMSSAADIANVDPELFSKFEIIFYNSPVDAVYKALGVE
jgi:ATP-dependent Lon protease